MPKSYTVRCLTFRLFHSMEGYTDITFCHFLLATALGNSNNIHEVFLTSPYAVTLPRGFPKDLRKFWSAGLRRCTVVKILRCQSMIGKTIVLMCCSLENPSPMTWNFASQLHNACVLCSRITVDICKIQSYSANQNIFDRFYISLYHQCAKGIQ